MHLKASNIKLIILSDFTVECLYLFYDKYILYNLKIKPETQCNRSPVSVIPFSCVCFCVYVCILCFSVVACDYTLHKNYI